eukprot:363712-Chlamydomonas_euryale.AAC.12
MVRAHVEAVGRRLARLAKPKPAPRARTCMHVNAPRPQAMGHLRAYMPEAEEPAEAPICMHVGCLEQARSSKRP